MVYDVYGMLLSSTDPLANVTIDLEPEAQEKDTGPFRADILCKNSADETWVVIEIKSSERNHHHLGQLLIYPQAACPARLI